MNLDGHEHCQIETLKYKLLILKELSYTFLKNYFLHETILFNDQDPQWVSKRIKFLLEKGKLSLKTFCKNRHNADVIDFRNNIGGCLALLDNTTNKIIKLEWLKS